MAEDDILQDDNDLDAFVYDMMQKYKKKLKSLNLDRYKDENGKDYIKLIGISISDKFKGQGIGKEVMHDVINYADDHSIPIKLWATDVFGSNIERLVNFYKNFGFVEVDNEHHMIYTPKKVVK